MEKGIGDRLALLEAERHHSQFSLLSSLYATGQRHVASTKGPVGRSVGWLVVRLHISYNPSSQQDGGPRERRL